MVDENINKKKNKKVKLILILATVIIIPVFIFASVAAYLVLSFKPSGTFEGMWQGGMRINEVKDDSGGFYDDIKSKNIGLIVDVDEQSKGYGHIRLRTEEGKPLGDVFFPCVFKNGLLEVDDEELEMKAKIITDHGRAYLEGDFVLKQLNGETTIRGTFSAEKTASEANIFDFGRSEIPPLE